MAGIIKEFADLNHRGHIGSPTPGVVTTVVVEQGQSVDEGQKLLVLEAMKMQSAVYARGGQGSAQARATGADGGDEGAAVVIE